MVPELGTFAIILAFSFAILQGFSPIIASFKKAPHYFTFSMAAAFGQVLFLVFAMLCLIFCFLTNDMTVIYVRDHSHTLLPILYRIGAAWGGHEGSLLLWCLILSGWTFVYMLCSINKKLPYHTTGIYFHNLSILGFISAGFILFLFATSNPFQRDFPTAPVVGNDLTPILQDPGLIFHPPMLYMGYVGFAIAFAFAISALLKGKFDKEWAKTCRPWVIMPWSFLSCGIVLGSWWAYRELGWGGWWFWDPVENASLLPWLSATALLHSLIVSEKRDVFKGWTILLAIVTFTLSLLGTFLVRSGVLVSVHAFASDPTRGLYLLSYLSIIIGGAFTLYACRIHLFYRAPHFQLFSRETFLLSNSVFLLASVATIVLGTLYPIILDALNLGKISVGEPYFNTVFLPIVLPLLVLIGIAPHIHWGEHSFKNAIHTLSTPLLLSIVIGCITPRLFGFPFYLLTTVGISFSVWIILATLHYAYSLYKKHHVVALQHWAMIIAHLGIAVIALGVTINKSYSVERQVKMAPGESAIVAGYTFTLTDINKIEGKNYHSISAHFDVTHHKIQVNELIAEQRIYTSHDETLSKPGVLYNPWRDLYIALGNSLSDGAWSVRIYYKPFVRWIWCGGFMLLLGGFLSLLSHWTRQRLHHESA